MKKITIIVIWILSASACAYAGQGMMIPGIGDSEPKIQDQKIHLLQEVMKGSYRGIFISGEKQEDENGRIYWLFDCPFSETLKCYSWEKHLDGSLDLYGGNGSLLEHYPGPMYHVSHYETSYIDGQGQTWMHYVETFDPVP